MQLPFLTGLPFYIGDNNKLKVFPRTKGTPIYMHALTMKETCDRQNFLFFPKINKRVRIHFSVPPPYTWIRSNSLKCNWVVKGVALLLHEITPNSEGFQSKSRVMRLGMPFVQNILMWGLSKFEIVVGNWVLNGVPSALKTHWAVLVDISKQQTFLKYILSN